MTKTALMLPILLWMLSFTAVSEGVPSSSQKIGISTADREQWADQLANADWAATVTIASVSDLINPSMSKNKGMYAVQGYRYTADVVEGVKGVDAQQIQFDVDFTACLNRFSAYKTYLVFGQLNAKEGYQVTNCDNVIAAN